jgi:hypothetical protein
MNALRQMNVGISGAVPDPHEMEKYGGNYRLIHLMVRRIVERVLEEDGNITYGSHPTFTPIIESVVTRMSGANQTKRVKRVRMFVAKRFFAEEAEWKNFYSRHNAYAMVKPVGQFDTERDPALTQLRKRMINNADALICIGGRFHADDPKAKPGVGQEVEIALRKQIPVYLVGICGGYTRHLYEQELASDANLLRNKLSQTDNEALAKSADIWEAVNLILKGLTRIHTTYR